MTMTFEEAIHTGQCFLFDGSTPTVLYERGVYINRSFDEANLGSPELVQAIHQEFRAGGAQVLTTNTWAANRLKLQGYGLAENLGAINVKGAQLARTALDDEGPGWVAGCIGPLGVRLEPLVATESKGEAVALHLEKLFQKHGPPLFLKRDNGSSLNHAAVDRVLADYGVIPLNSPAYYPKYNGSIEKGIRDMKTALGECLPQAVTWQPEAIRPYILAVHHELNCRPRRSLQGHTASKATPPARPTDTCRATATSSGSGTPFLGGYGSAQTTASNNWRRLITAA